MIAAAAAPGAAPAAEPRLTPSSPPGNVPAPADPLCCDALRSDAALADVCFVDRLHGWAVGDRGAIWHTDDGGDRWHLQPTDVACRLESVFFLDGKTGWAVGGRSHPYLHTGAGVVLATRDGGQHWTRVPKLVLPWLKRIGFFNERHGWALGCPSAMYPSGVFVSDSGGRGWSGVPGPRSPGWLAGSFLDPGAGAMAGRGGAAAALRHGALEAALLPALGLRDPADMKLIAPCHGWLVGQGGLVFLTADGGSTWQSPAVQPLPPAVARCFDLVAVEVRGARCWLAGSPGTLIFHTADFGRSWIAAPTGQNLPIDAICFADDEHGWAVGQLGTILATEDGGRSWRRQRGGGRRAAVLGLFSQPADVPLELFARLAAEEGYLAAVELLNRRDLEVPSRHDVHLADRAHEALVGVGACAARTAWQFPLHQPGLCLAVPRILEGWDRAVGGQGLAELEAHLVRQIRLWRPDVILTHDPNARADPVHPLLAQAVLRAVDQAADPSCHAEQMELAVLAPWQVKKVYASLGPVASGAVDLATSQLAARLGRSLVELAAGPRSLVEDRFRDPPQSLGFYPLLDRLTAESGRKDFFAGISLPPASDARRALVEPAAESALTLRQLAQRRRNTQAILDRALRDPPSAVRLLAEAGDLTEGLDPESSAQVLWRMGQGYYRGGQWDLAAETFELLVARHADHPLARAAIVWLLHYQTSSEAQWRAEGRQPTSGQRAPALAIDAARLDQRRRRLGELVRRLEQTWPDLLADPSLGFPLAAWDRLCGQPQQAERFYLAQRHRPTRDAWWACAQGEAWLAARAGPPPKPVVACAAAPARPHLDGRLDDAVWQAAQPVELRSPQHDDAEWPCSVMLAHDEQFLYLTIRARRAPGARYDPAAGVRPRDPDLGAQDRVEVFLDLDRDFTTYYRLAVDYRGWAQDACWEDATWDPTWFVAAGGDAGEWTVEAAMPWDQLAGRCPSAGTVWAVGLARIAPGAGFQSFSAPAAVEVIPEGFGYVSFE